jgi:hypothetical protein
MRWARGYKLPRFLTLAAALAFLLTTGCGVSGGEGQPSAQETRVQETASVSTEPSDREEESVEVKQSTGGSETAQLHLSIDGAAVQVSWEDNESVNALRELCAREPLEVSMSMYGGFEQVGDLGQPLPRDDKQTTTRAGDIVLYAGDSVVVFYGSNSWAYTRLGRITDPSEAELAQMLGSGDVKLTFELE